MKAILCKAHGPPETLVFEDVPSPTPASGEVIVTMKAAGVNFPDALIIQDRYQVKPPLPFSPGAEAAGVIKEVGEGVSDYACGDRVIALTTYGAFAEELKIASSRLIRIPESMNFTTAAAFMLTFGTAHHALVDRAALAPGETLLVLGAAGGIGLAAVEIGKAMGARVIACASTDEKLTVCAAHGADDTVNYVKQNLREAVKHVTGTRGVDVVFDPVGGPYTEPALRSLAWRGRLLVVGFAAGEIPKIPTNLALLKGCSVVGVFWGEFVRREPVRLDALAQQLFAWHATGVVAPHISRTLPLERAPEAIAALSARAVLGKIVLLA